MEKPAVISMIIPVYGVEQYISEFADSVFGQSCPDVQYVFVNDGTRDRSIEVLNELVDSKYPHLREQILIVHKENAGLPAARKTGLEHATGDYVYHVDPDDWLSPGSLEAIVAKCRETDADIVFFNYVKEYSNRSSVKKEREYSIEQKNEYIRNMYNHRAFGTLCNKCVKRSLYEHVHHPLYSYAEDCFLSVQLVGYARSIAYLDMDVYHYRKNNPSSITRQGRKRRKNEYAMNFLNLYELYKDQAPETNPVAVLSDDILMQAGWYSIAYGLGLFDKYPYLAAGIRKARIKTGSDVWVPFQVFVKCCAFFLNR